MSYPKQTSGAGYSQSAPAAGYPAQGGYPGQAPPPQMYTQPQAYGAAGYPQYAHGQQAPPPPYSAYPQNYMSVNRGATFQQGYPGAQAYQPQTAYVVPGAFDAGARFDSAARPNIPPPPPGHVPNAAQMAAMQGHSVVMTQRPGNFMTGGSDGGYTIW